MGKSPSTLEREIRETVASGVAPRVTGSPRDPWSLTPLELQEAIAQVIAGIGPSGRVSLPDWDHLVYISDLYDQSVRLPLFHGLSLDEFKSLLWESAHLPDRLARTRLWAPIDDKFLRGVDLGKLVRSQVVVPPSGRGHGRSAPPRYYFVTDLARQEQNERRVMERRRRR